MSEDPLFPTILAVLTFTSLGGHSLRITGGQKAVSVFPGKNAEGDMNLLPSPQEEGPDNAISWPGEYDVAGITVRGIGHGEGQQVSYLIEDDGTRCAFPCSPLLEWSEEDIERLGDVHVLALPAENSKVVQKLLDEVDPRVLLLVPGKDGKLDSDVLKVCGAVGKEQVSEYKLKGSLPAEGREVVVFAS